MPDDYAEPVARLLAYGAVEWRRGDEPWPDYLALGFTRDHVDDLIRMIDDDALHCADGESAEVWAPMHAWRTLGQLGAAEAAEPLVRLLQRLPDDDWLRSELPQVFSLIGPQALPAAIGFLADAGVDEMNRISAPACLERTALDHPECRDACVAALEGQLARHWTNGPTLNAFLILSLVKLRATEAIGIIRAAFAADTVDLTVQGDVEDVEIDLGLRRERETPPPKLELIPGFSELVEALAEQGGFGEGNVFADDTGSADDTGFADETVVNPFRHVGRNDPCPCGSGQKFKKCCGDPRAASALRTPTLSGP